MFVCPFPLSRCRWKAMPSRLVQPVGCRLFDF
jgi:hypothetical protein